MKAKFFAVARVVSFCLAGLFTNLIAQRGGAEEACCPQTNPAATVSSNADSGASASSAKASNTVDSAEKPQQNGPRGRGPSQKQTISLDSAPGGTAASPSAEVFSAQSSIVTIESFLDEHEARYLAALARARKWLDELKVDPADLRARGIKGKKKLVELLDVYLRLYAVASAQEKPALAARIGEIAAVTYRPEYHDLAQISDRQFKEDSTSYLRLAFLMDRFGLDTKLYRREIEKTLPRLNAHMKYRGTDQRMAFHLYYRHFGLSEPFPLAEAFQAGLIASRHESAWFKRSRMEIYNLTHEIFVPYEFGEKLDADFFSDADQAYLRPLLANLTAYTIALDDADLTAELTSCLRYLHFSDLKIYQEALRYLLKSQWPDGKWGNYEQARLHYGDYVNQAFYLHTTLVVVDALTTAFHYRERCPVSEPSRQEPSKKVFKNGHDGAWPSKHEEN